MSTSPIRPTLRWVLRGVTFASGLCALSLLLLPLMLALLMLLFDSTAEGVMVLLGSIASWFRSALPGGNALPAYRSLSLDPASIALAAAARMLPCLAGLVFCLVWPRRRSAWAATATVWLLAMLFDGRLVGIVLTPGLSGALLLSFGPGLIDDTDRHPA